MRLMTYNIRLGFQEGLGAVARVIEEAAPDVVALQEVGRYWRMGPRGDTLARLSELVGLRHRVFVHAHAWFPPAQYGHGLLSRWPVRHPVRELLPKQGDEPRTLLRCTIDGPDGPFRMLTTHLSHVEDRRLQHPVLIEHIERELESRRPLIVAGDLNETDDASWIADLQRRLDDADASRSRPTFPADEPTSRIDYLLASSGAWSDVDVPAATSASDHRPVVATLRL